MLKHHATKEVIRPDGVHLLVITDELIDDPCKCGAESVPNLCNGDGRYHHHGRIHTRPDRRLEAMCAACAEKDREDWGPRPWQR